MLVWERGVTLTEDFSTQYTGKTVAITGAGGYLAPAILDALGPHPDRIFLVSGQELPGKSGVVNIQADIRAADCWQEIVTSADVIFHLASNTSVYAASEDPVGCLDSTVKPVSQLVCAAQVLTRQPRVVIASTVTQYGITNDLPVSEKSPQHPITNYDLQKMFSEKQLLLASSQGVLEGVSLRLGNVYGPSSNTNASGDRGVLNKISRLALKGAKLQVYGDGNYIRDYVHINDVARAFLAAGVSESVVGHSFNIASGQGVTIRDAFRLVAERAEAVTGRKVAIKNIPWPIGAEAIECRNFVADINAIKLATGWSPLISFEYGVEQMIHNLMPK